MSLLRFFCAGVLVLVAFTPHSSKATDGFYFRYSADEAGSRCTTPNRESGQCILLPKCAPLMELLKKQPRPPGAVAFLRQSQCGVEGRYPLVCCSERRTPGGPVVPPPPPNTQSPPTRPTGGSSLASHPNSRLLPIDSCGQQFSERIIGGIVAELDEYPWLVQLWYRTPSGNERALCGGVLISKRYVLTASHCINGDLRGSRMIKVRLGEYNQTTELDCVVELTGETNCADPYVDVNIEKAIPHPDYSASSKHQTSDIGLLRLARDVSMTEFIQPICLPLSSEQTRDIRPGTPLWVAGWGRTEAGVMSQVKLKVAVPVVDNAACQEVYKRNNRELQPTQICAGGMAGKDSCTGDSGGPLMSSSVLRDKSIHTVAGVVSFGPRDCGMEGWPGVYSRVESFMPWIMDQLKP